MTIKTSSKVGEIAAEFPLATRVFARHGIDFCCGGGRPLSEACERRGVEVGAVIDDIEKELASTSVAVERWDKATPDDLIDHIVGTYHRSLHEEMPRLRAMARKVLDVHGDKDRERLSELHAVVAGLEGELHDHMEKEEQILFPMIKVGDGLTAGDHIRLMEDEHESAGAALRRLRELTGDYQVPEGACNTWRALWVGLEALEKSMHQHIHLENNILFPRSLAE